MYRCFLYLCFSALFLLNPTTANAKCVFKGEINFIEKKIELELNFKKKEGVIIHLNFLPDDKFSLSAKLNHLRIANSCLSTELNSQGEIMRDRNGEWIGLKGSIQTNYSLLNFKPSKEINGYFKFKQSSLSIYSLIWKNLRISGEISLEIPCRLNLSVDIIDMDINELASLLAINLEGISLSGLVSGHVEIEGILPVPEIKGELRFNNGNIETLKYNAMLINIDGVYPILKFVDSNIFEKNGQIYYLIGKFNLKELDNLTLLTHNLKLIPSVDDDFSWQAWTIRRKKSYGQDDLVEFEYQLKEDRPFKMRLREDEEIFSLEHSLRF